MANKPREYFYVDININNMNVIDWGQANTANHTGDSDDPQVHRLFLTKGQFNKLKKKLEQ